MGVVVPPQVPEFGTQTSASPLTLLIQIDVGLPVLTIDRSAPPGTGVSVGAGVGVSVGVGVGVSVATKPVGVGVGVGVGVVKHVSSKMVLAQPSPVSPPTLFWSPSCTRTCRRYLRLGDNGWPFLSRRSFRFQRT